MTSTQNNRGKAEALSQVASQARSEALLRLVHENGTPEGRALAGSLLSVTFPEPYTPEQAKEVCATLNAARWQVQPNGRIGIAVEVGGARRFVVSQDPAALVRGVSDTITDGPKSWGRV